LSKFATVYLNSPANSFRGSVFIFFKMAPISVSLAFN